MNETEKLLDFVEARLEMTYAYGLSALEWNRKDVAQQILRACKQAGLKFVEVVAEGSPLDPSLPVKIGQIKEIEE